MVADDAIGCYVGKCAFQAITDFDAHAVFLGGNDDQYPIVLLAPPQFPDFEHPHREVLDALFAQPIDREDRYLVAGCTFMRLQHIANAAARGRGKDFGLVDDAAGKVGHGRLLSR